MNSSQRMNAIAADISTVLCVGLSPGWSARLCSIPPVMRNSGGPVAGLPIITVHPIALANRDR